MIPHSHGLHEGLGRLSGWQAVIDYGIHGSSQRDAFSTLPEQETFIYDLKFVFSPSNSDFENTLVTSTSRYAALH